MGRKGNKSLPNGLHTPSLGGYPCFVLSLRVKLGHIPHLHGVFESHGEHTEMANCFEGRIELEKQLCELPDRIGVFSLNEYAIQDKVTAGVARFREGRYKPVSNQSRSNECFELEVFKKDGFQVGRSEE